MIDWASRVAEGKRIHEFVRQVDQEGLWDPGPPNPGASARELEEVENLLGYPLDPSYRDFLRYANGWPQFYQTVSLFGTDDLLGSPLMEVARLQLDAISEQDFQTDTGLTFDSALPIAATTENSDMFLLAGREAPRPGEIVWLAGYPIEVFTGFVEFYQAMLEYYRTQVSEHDS